MTHQGGAVGNEVSDVMGKSCDAVTMVSHTKVRQGETEKGQPVATAQPPSALKKRRGQRSSAGKKCSQCTVPRYSC